MILSKIHRWKSFLVRTALHLTCITDCTGFPKFKICLIQYGIKLNHAITRNSTFQSIEGQVLPSLNVHSMHDFPVQLSAVRALLRKRFRNPFITPTEKQLFRVQRRLGRLKKYAL